MISKVLSVVLHRTACNLAPFSFQDAEIRVTLQIQLCFIHFLDESWMLCPIYRQNSLHKNKYVRPYISIYACIYISLPGKAGCQPIRLSSLHFQNPDIQTGLVMRRPIYRYITGSGLPFRSLGKLGDNKPGHYCSSKSVVTQLFQKQTQLINSKRY